MLKALVAIMMVAFVAGITCSCVSDE